ncbi:DNA replication ATP-dependent helicase/nuclease JHS1, partial [Linum grandiflorum]
ERDRTNVERERRTKDVSVNQPYLSSDHRNLHFSSRRSFNMPPRKKLKPSSAAASKKKSENSSSSSAAADQHNPRQSQNLPSKFGIQHFFNRHNSQIQTTNATPCSSNHPPPPPQKQQQPTFAKLGVVSALDARNPNSASTAAQVVSSPPPEVSLRPNPGGIGDGSPGSFVSPVNGVTSKSVSRHRFVVSPRLLIKQSQDDGADEVTWKISPVNERLQAVSKHSGDTIKTLAESSRLSSFAIHHCTEEKESPTTSDKFLKPHSSLVHKPIDVSAIRDAKAGCKTVKASPEIVVEGVGSASSQPSPFRTPPSLTCHHDKIANIFAGASDQLSLGHHKKALIELLDQVEDAISIEDLMNGGSSDCSSKFEEKVCQQTTINVGPERTSKRLDKSSSSSKFLVLEVCEKHGRSDALAVERPYKVLRLLNEQTGEEQAVSLWEEWFYSVVAPGDTVNVIGEFDQSRMCNVDKNHNLLVVHPDILVSGTRVSGSFDCPRRAVLDERLKSFEHSAAALIGTLLHQIFQDALEKENPDIDFMKGYAKVVMQKNIESLYACGVNENDVLETLVGSIPKLVNWIARFRNIKDPQMPIVEFGSKEESKKLRVLEVVDIEEMALSTKYGLKGNIDASLRVIVESNAEESGEKIMPLEFKSGKVRNGQISTEHSVQVILYTLLMSERYREQIDSGLLFYLQSDLTQGIKVRRSDVTGIIMRRNELANDIRKASTSQVLPPMLKSPWTCKNCRHLDVCTVYHKVHGGTVEDSGLGELYEANVRHLTTAHAKFLRHWDRLIDLEAKETQTAKSEIWHTHGTKGDSSTKHLPSFVLGTTNELQQQPSVKDKGFIYRFVCKSLSTQGADRKLQTGVSNLDHILKAGDYVVLSTVSDQQIISRGVVADIDRSQVSVSVTKRLRLPRSTSSGSDDLLHEIWHINKDEFMTSFSVMRSNITSLFSKRERSSHLRRMIVDLEAPRFDSGCVYSQDPAISYIWSVKTLNSDQRRAILKMLAAKDYALVLGMPGTGKTSTVVHAVKAFLLRGSSVLLTSYTNSAIDNLLIKLKAQGIDFLRIGRQGAVHEEIRDSCCADTDLESIKQRLDQVRVVGVTCLGITSPLLTSKHFDVCIMDEAGQITFPISLGPLMFSLMFVLVGDHYQLPPLVQSAEARENGMGISLFCRLCEAHPQAILALQSQYRMSEGIMQLSNALIYGDRLQCGSSEVANTKLKVPNLKSCSSWLQEVLNPDRAVVFINTDMLPTLGTNDSKSKNPIEAYIVAEVVKVLTNNGTEGKDIGIITPYNAQTNLLKTVVRPDSVEIHTIDKYQGRDKDCIMVSFVRSAENPRSYSSSLLGDWHRINVAITRAKKKLIMVGSCRTLSKVPLLKLLVEKVAEQCGVLKLRSTDINLQQLESRYEDR